MCVKVQSFRLCALSLGLVLKSALDVTGNYSATAL